MTKRWMALGLFLVFVQTGGCDCGAATTPEHSVDKDASTVTADASVDGGSVDGQGQDGAVEDGANQNTDAGMMDDSGISSDAGSTNDAALNDSGVLSDSGQVSDAGQADTANQAPSVTISSPQDNDSFSRGETITFTCVATDPEDGSVANGSIVWTSDAEGGQIGVGATIQTALSTEGTHHITCTATDSGGLSSSASISINIVGNFAPVVSIDSPSDGAYFAENSSISFVGSALDNEDGVLSGASLTWHEGASQLGSGVTLQTVLSTGDHIISLRAQDSNGALGEASITIHVVSNLPPVCQILLPADGATVIVGESVDFSASCTDPDGSAGINNADIHWSSDQDGALGIGAQITNALTSEGTHSITVCATDTTDSSLEGCASISLNAVANQAPVVTINRPAEGDSIEACHPVNLGCSATDPEGQTISYRWLSSLEGELGSSRNLTWTPTQSGSHVLTCEATDSLGAIGTAQVSISVLSPAVAISNPSDGDMFAPGDTVNFAGNACDSEDGTLSGASLVWTSSVDGQLGTGNSLTTSTLSAGSHQITLTATDSDNNSASASITVVINTPPTVQITAPNDGSTEQNPVTFTADANDAEDGALSPDWSSGSSGALGSGASLTVSDLPLGKQIISASVTDSLGSSASDQITITVDDGQSLFANINLGGGGNQVRVVRVVADPDGGWWLATDNGLYHWDGSDSFNSTQRFSDNNSDLPDNDVRDVIILADGRIAVATDGGGLGICEIINNITTGWQDYLSCDVYGDGDISLNTDSIRSLLQLPDGRILIGTDNCMVFWDQTSGQHQEYCKDDGGGDGLIEDKIQDLAYDPVSGHVWIATDGGASEFSPAPAPSVQDSAAQHFSDFNSGDGLADNDVRALTVTASGAVWFACDGGLTRLERNNAGQNIVRNWTTNEGLPSNNLRDVAVDNPVLGGVEREVAWVASSAGLVRVDPDLDNVVVITSSDGLLSNDCRSVDIYEHIKYVGTNRGLSTYRGL